MKRIPMTVRPGRHFLASALLLAAQTLVPLQAEPATEVNGAAIDQSVLDLYIQSRTNRPAAEATDQERELLTAELSDIYLLSTQESAARLAREPRISAQIELQRRGILAQAVAAEFYSTSSVTDKEIADEYAAQIEMAPAQQFKARHILVETQGEATEIIGLLNNGAVFEELAKERSTGPSGPSGGDLGWFSPDQMVPSFSQAVAGLEDGAYSTEPVQTQFGWHVVLREDSRSTEPPTLESARENIIQQLQNRKFEAYLTELRKASAD